MVASMAGVAAAEVAAAVLLIGLVVTLPHLLLFFELPLFPENTLCRSSPLFFLVIIRLMIPCSWVRTTFTN
jgi:hypothetical protein